MSRRPFGPSVAHDVPATAVCYVWRRLMSAELAIGQSLSARMLPSGWMMMPRAAWIAILLYGGGTRSWTLHCREPLFLCDSRIDLLRGFWTCCSPWRPMPCRCGTVKSVGCEPQAPSVSFESSSSADQSCDSFYSEDSEPEP